MTTDGNTNATTRRLARLRRPAVRIAGPVLALLLTGTGTAIAVPAQAAAVSTNAGASWSQIMQRKLALATDSVRLTALLPGLRTTVTIRSSDLAKAQRIQRTATLTLTAAAAADQNASTRYATARTEAKAASSAVTAAQNRRPRYNSGITRARRALATANAALLARAGMAARAAAAAKTARNMYTAGANRVSRATIASQTAAKAVSDTRLRIASIPTLTSALAVQATALSTQVVTQTRGTFTTTQTTQVYGVTVNKIVAYPFQRMIDDAAKAGIQLSGGGFRTKQQQIALRTTNGCPDVWTAPSSSCRVPTAIPGRSLHEIGLAIDMTSSRKAVSSRKSAAFKWLAANAGKYGFVNLPSEPWHWSITGS